MGRIQGEKVWVGRDVQRGLSKQREKPVDEKVGNIKETADSLMWCKWEEDRQCEVK